jgi:hypothetical protein
VRSWVGGLLKKSSDYKNTSELNFTEKGETFLENESSNKEVKSSLPLPRWMFLGCFLLLFTFRASFITYG